MITNFASALHPMPKQKQIKRSLIRLFISHQKRHFRQKHFRGCFLLSSSLDRVSKFAFVSYQFCNNPLNTPNVHLQTNNPRWKHKPAVSQPQNFNNWTNSNIYAKKVRKTLEGISLGHTSPTIPPPSVKQI